MRAKVAIENDWFSWCAKFVIARDLVHLIQSSKSNSIVAGAVSAQRPIVEGVYACKVDVRALEYENISGFQDSG